MHDRCHTETHKSFPDYGGRGVKICSRWNRRDRHGNEAFANYVEDIESLGPMPFLGAQVDRIDNDGNYEPGNVRWADSPTQGKNQRRRTEKQKAAYQEKSRKMREREQKMGASLSDDQVREVRSRLTEGENCPSISAAMDISRNVVHKIKQGKTYTHVE